MVNPELPKDHQQVDDQLSKEIIAISNKIEDHLSDLENIIKNGEADNEISGKHKELESEVNALLAKVTDEYVLTDEARIAMHGLQERVQLSQESAKDAKEKTFENSTIAGKVQILTEKWKLPAALTLWIGKAVREVGHEVSSRKWFWNKTWWLIKGIFSGLVWWGITYLWATAAGYVAWLIDGLDPRNRAKKAKNDVKGWRNNLFRKTWERYDPKNQEVQDVRNDSDPETPWFEWPEMWMDDLNRPIFWRKDWRTELAVLPDDIQLPWVYMKDQVDAIYGDPAFSDKYLLFTTSVNMRTQAARAKDQSGGIFSTKDSEIGSIQLIEQELLNIQKQVQSGADKWVVNTSISKTMNHISDFEIKQKSVIWEERWKVVLPTINEYSTTVTTRDADYENAQLKMYDWFRKTWGVTQGNSEVVKRHLYEDLLHRAKYEKLDDLFDGETGEKIFDALWKISPESKSDEELSSLVGKHLLDSGFLENPGEGKSWLSESVISEITKSIITTYHKSKENVNNNTAEFKKYFTRAYGFEIETDTKQQQKMITAYEQMYSVEVLEQYAQQKWLTYNKENKRQVVWGFAWDMVKENAIHGAVLSAYQDTFFDSYLPTQSERSRALRSPVETYKYADKKEGMLADIIWAGDDIADSTINSAINVWINIAASLIPVAGVEFVAARIAWSMLMRWILTAGTMSSRVAIFSMRAVLGHIAMTTFAGIANEQPASEIFENLTDRKEFAQNAIFFNVIWQVGPRITKNVWRIPRLGKVDPAVLEKLSTHWTWRLAMMTWAWVAETTIIEGGRNICDPNYERNWWEVMTVFMMSTILAGKVWAKAKEYTATKTANGKIKIIPKNITRIASKVESIESSSKTLRGKYEERLLSARDWETTIMGGQVVKSTKDWTSTYMIKWETTSFATAKEVVTHLKVTRLGEKPTIEQTQAIWEQELGTKIENMIDTWKTFSKGSDVYKFQVDKEGVVQVMKKWEKWFIQLTEEEIATLSQANEQLVTNATKKLFENVQWSKKSMKELLDSGKISKQEFTDRCKTHNITWTEKMLVGDFFRLLWQGKVRELLFWNIKKLQWISWRYPFPGMGKIIWAGKNSTTLFQAGSILYGGLIGDNGDKGRDEAAENYFLYCVLGRWIVGRVALAALDASDILF